MLVKNREEFGEFEIITARKELVVVRQFRSCLGLKSLVMIAHVQTEMAPSALLIVAAVFAFLLQLFQWRSHCTANTAQSLSYDSGDFQNLRTARMRDDEWKQLFP